MDELAEPVVSPEWVLRQMQRPSGQARLRFVDASWRLPGSTEPPAREAFAKRRLPGAVFFDLEAVSDRSSPLPHMAPSREAFDAEMRRLGIGRGDRIIVYDDKGVYSAARVWWTFRRMGRLRTSVLDGGLPGWTAIGGDIQSGSVQPPVARTSEISESNPWPSASGEDTPASLATATAEDVRKALADRSARVLDARPAARFYGEAAEPRPGLRRGAMPGAVNLPFATLLNEQGCLLPDDSLRAIFENVGVGPDTPVIATCGSGITAAIIILALAKLGYSRHALYDGSWAEWGLADNDPALFPVVARRARADGRQD